MSRIPPGPICAAGGTRVDVGIDSNGNGVLEPSEVQQTADVCSGAPPKDAGTVTDGGNHDR